MLHVGHLSANVLQQAVALLCNLSVQACQSNSRSNDLVDGVLVEVEARGAPAEMQAEGQAYFLGGGGGRGNIS